MPQTKRPLILIADDQEDIRKSLGALLKNRGYNTAFAPDPTTALRLIDEHPVDAILLDLNYSRDTTSGQEGLELLDRINVADPQLPVVVMTAWATLDVAIKAMQQGAGDFIEKPWDNERLLSVLQNQLELRRTRFAVESLKAENMRLTGTAHVDFVSHSSAMEPVIQLIERIGPTDASVLVTGAHGTGKGVIARLLHARSGRAAQSMVTVNIGAIPDNLFESELFGHVKGAFTDARSDREGRFKLADQGTLFLDEIGNLSAAMQAKLLRVIETGEYEPVGSSRTHTADVRLISATNADLPAMVRQGTFREDLLFRLNPIVIDLPTLNQRREDIGPLAEHFLTRYSQKYCRQELYLSDAARHTLENHPWPGNVRELDHVIQRGVLMAHSESINASDLGFEAPPVDTVDVDGMTLEEMEKWMIRNALRQCNGNIKEAAQKLGLGRGALYRRLEKYGMEPQ